MRRTKKRIRLSESGLSFLPSLELLLLATATKLGRIAKAQDFHDHHPRFSLSPSFRIHAARSTIHVPPLELEIDSPPPESLSCRGSRCGEEGAFPGLGFVGFGMNAAEITSGPAGAAAGRLFYAGSSCSLIDFCQRPAASDPALAPSLPRSFPSFPPSLPPLPLPQLPA